MLYLKSGIISSPSTFTLWIIPTFPSNLIVTYILLGTYKVFYDGIKLEKLSPKMERLKVKELKALSKSLGLRDLSFFLCVGGSEF